jgi:hypothetical protein
MTSIAWIRWAAPLAVGLSMAACGGGGGGGAEGSAGDPPGSPNAEAQVPANAGASSASLVQFLKGLVTTEVGEPLQVGTFDPPRAETAEPEKLY